MTGRRARDIEKAYPLRQFIAKLRRLADDLESGEQFTIQVAGERITVPARAIVNIEHEREATNEEIEFQIKWTNARMPSGGPGVHGRRGAGGRRGTGSRARPGG